MLLASKNLKKYIYATSFSFHAGTSQPKQQKKKISKANKQVEPVTNVVEKPSVVPESDQNVGGKKKTKFVNLYSQEGKNAQVVLLKGDLQSIA